MLKKRKSCNRFLINSNFLFVILFDLYLGLQFLGFFKEISPMIDIYYIQYLSKLKFYNSNYVQQLF
jgi:hypothetical protein